MYVSQGVQGIPWWRISKDCFPFEYFRKEDELFILNNATYFSTTEGAFWCSFVCCLYYSLIDWLKIIRIKIYFSTFFFVHEILLYYQYYFKRWNFLRKVAYYLVLHHTLISHTIYIVYIGCFWNCFNIVKEMIAPIKTNNISNRI